MNRACQFLFASLTCLTFLANEQLAGGAEPYQVGVAKLDITPEYPIRLNGFGFRREESEGVSQRIWAKALAISRAQEPPVVLIAIDSLGIRLPMVEQVAKRLHDQLQIPRQNVAVTFSHSHCTPKVNGACDNIFSSPIPASHQEHIDRYTKELTEKLFEVASAAVSDRKESTLEWNIGKVGFAKNRRTPGGPVDHDLPMLVVKSMDGKPRAIYVSYACHCVTLSFNQVSGDWSGYAQELIERKFPGVVALVSVGCGSDSNPDSGVTGDKVDVASQQGAQIADEIGRMLGGDCRPLEGNLTARLQFIELPLNRPPTREQLQELAKKDGPAGYNAETQLAKLDRGQTLPTAIHYPVQSFTFGDRLQMIFLAGEVCVDYSTRLKRELDHDRLWVNGYSNDFCAYIPSERLVKEGGYGGGAETPYFALPATLQSGLEQQIVDEVRRQTPSGFFAASDTQGIPPKSPADSMQCLQTHEDLRIELVAAEPLVADPVAIDFGPDGRLWVVEMTNYARGVNEEFSPSGRVRFLTDSDGDSQYDKVTEFLTGLRFPTDVKVWRDGVLICDAPDILFAADRDGDGQAEIRKVLFSGFATHNPHARVNSLRYGLDNWVYGSGGLFGGKITSADGRTVDVRNRDFRMHPDKLEMEPVTGQTQQGRPRDDWDNWFGCTNGTLLTHYVVDDHYARRNPHVAPPSSAVYVPDYPNSERLFPRGDLVLFKLSGAPGRPTSACGAEIYRDELLGEAFTGNAFTCEPVNQLVHRLVLNRKGSTFSGRRAKEESSSEFMTSTDRWFRPVQVRTGPDGALWIVDMYRYVIEHPQWIPPETLTGLNVFAGQGLGRIYRVVSKNQPARKPVRFDGMSVEEAANAMNSPNGVQRDLAQELLVLKGKGAKDCVQPLTRIVRTSQWPAARVQAASTLAGLKQLQPDLVLALLSDAIPEVRRHGIRLSESFLNDSPEVLTAVLRLVDDPAAEVRMQLAYSLGECRDERSATALANLATQTGNDVYLNHAVMSSIRPDNVVQVLRTALTRDQRIRESKAVESLLAAAAAMGDNSTVGAVIGQIVADDGQEKETDPKKAPWRWRTLVRVFDAADRRKLALENAVSKETRRQILDLYDAARKVLGKESVDEDHALAAIQFLGRSVGPSTQSLVGEKYFTQQDVQLLVGLLASRYSPVIQSASVKGLARVAGSSAPKVLLESWPDSTPRLRAEILDALLARDEWLTELLSAMERGTVAAGDFDASRRQRLLSHKKAEVRERAERLLAGSTNSNRKEIVAAWQSVLELEGDKQRGREVYQKRCSVCHQLDGMGFQVGPDLAALTNRSGPSLLTAILDPNRDVDGRYVSYVATTTDGRTVSGMLVSEAGNSITLREQGGKDHVLLRTELDEFRATGKSVMPEGLEKDVSQQDVADIIAYLLPTRIPPKSFVGNQPQLIKPDKHGSLQLSASAAEIYGAEIVFESTSTFKNIGYWHGTSDYAGWQIELPSAGRFDVYLDYACADESAGNGYRLDGAEPTIRGLVAATGAWSNYRVSRIGTLAVPAGRTYLTMRFDGDKKRPALFDLRNVYLVPAGAQLATVAMHQAGNNVPADPVAIAQRILDDATPADVRQKLIADHPKHSAEIIAAMVADMPRDSKEEYRRIPWIWRVAISSGKRNETEDMRRVMDVALPDDGALQDWRAVVIGGGIINGITQAGDWPKARIEAVLKVDGVLIARWQKAVELAAAMADDEKVSTGTRYDALRMVAMGPWDLRGPQLRKYLAKGVHDELQMGAVSGVADVQHPQAAEALLSGMEHYSKGNRELALDGLVRTPERCLALLNAVDKGQVSQEQLGEKRIKQLLEHDDSAVMKKAKAVFKR